MTDCDIKRTRDRIVSLQSESPVASIVIPAFNEEKYILKTIIGLSKINTRYPIEIILIDNGSTDATKNIAESCGLKVFSEIKKGPSYARQTGIVLAKGEYIFSTDADTIVPTTWIDETFRYFSENPKLGLLAGKVIYRNASIFFYIAQFFLWTVYLFLGKKESEQVYGANMIYKKDIAQNVGGYIPGVNLGEDINLARRIKKDHEILITQDKKVTVYTSGRRFGTMKKVLKYIGTQWGKERKTYADTTIAKTDFIDIR